MERLHRDYVGLDELTLGRTRCLGEMAVTTLGIHIIDHVMKRSDRLVPLTPTTLFFRRSPRNLDDDPDAVCSTVVPLAFESVFVSPYAGSRLVQRTEEQLACENLARLLLYALAPQAFQHFRIAGLRLLMGDTRSTAIRWVDHPSTALLMLLAGNIDWKGHALPVMATAQGWSAQSGSALGLVGTKTAGTLSLKDFRARLIEFRDELARYRYSGTLLRDVIVINIADLMP